VAPQFFLLGLIVTVSAVPCDVLVAVSAAKVSQWLIRHEGAQVIQERVSGSILLGLGGYIVASELAGEGR
jgi:threonine/homoserine/homoserine lactone efflux protein